MDSIDFIRSTILEKYSRTVEFIKNQQEPLDRILVIIRQGAGNE